MNTPLQKHIDVYSYSDARPFIQDFIIEKQTVLKYQFPGKLFKM